MTSRACGTCGDHDGASRRGAALCGLGLVLAAASYCPTASAQEAEEAAPAEAPSATAEADTDAAAPSARKMDLSMDTPQPVESRSGYAHEGFYFRASVGPGWQWVNVNDRSDLDFDVSGNGFGMGANIFVGTSPSPGIALGGGLLTHFAFDVGLEHQDTQVNDGGVGYLIVGPFFDAYPDYKKGWHLGGELGFAFTGIEDVSNAVITNAYGAGIAGWLGYDWWVAPEWSAGANLQLASAYLFGSRNDADGRVTNVSTTLFISVLYN